MSGKREEIENELKYVLQKDFDQASLQGWERLELRVAYFENRLPDGKLDKFRVRDEGTDGELRFLKTYKEPTDQVGVVKEINKPITEEEFNALFAISGITLEKTRYVKKLDNDEECVVDFFKQDDGSTYFVMAEIEMPEGRHKPMTIPKEIADSILYAVPREKVTDFSSKKISNPDYAAKKLSWIAQQAP